MLIVKTSSKHQYLQNKKISVLIISIIISFAPGMENQAEESVSNNHEGGEDETMQVSYNSLSKYVNTAPCPQNLMFPIKL